MSGRPLSGIGVLVTRPAHQSGDLVAAIEAAGGRAVLFPVIDIIGREPNVIRAEVAALRPADIVIFVSANAVRHGLEAVAGRRPRVAAVGPATAAALAAAGVAVDIAPRDGSDTEHLLAEPALANVRGANVTIVRGESGRELLADTLRSRGAQVEYLSVYRRVSHVFPEAELTRLERDWQDGRIHAVVVLSAGAFGALLDALPASCVGALAEARLVAPSERVIQTVHERFPGARCILAPGPQAADLVGALAASLRDDP